MLAIATVVAMLAGLITQDRASFLSGQATHHYILLDDSLSMALEQEFHRRPLDLALAHQVDQVDQQGHEHKQERPGQWLEKKLHRLPSVTLLRFRAYRSYRLTISSRSRHAHARTDKLGQRCVERFAGTN